MNFVVENYEEKMEVLLLAEKYFKVHYKHLLDLFQHILCSKYHSAELLISLFKK